MNYEKAYKEALEKAREIVNNKDASSVWKNWLCNTFPELAESEDERIRKFLIEDIKDTLSSEGFSDYNPEHTDKLKEALAWLEKQGNKDKLIKELGEYKTKYTQEVLEKHINSMSNKDDEIRKALIKGFNECVASSSHYPENSIKYWHGIVIEDILAWLEKQCEKKQLYIRFGDVPSNETSKVYRGEVEIGDENGVSVYSAFEVNGNIVLGLTLPITKTTLYTQQHLLEYDNRPCYLVSGDYVGKGTDGEPLIRNISIIKRLDNYRIKELEKQGEQKASCTTIVETGNGGINALVTEELPTNDCDDEQNLADKVEPKFKVGDLIKHNKANIICKVISVNSGSYYVENIERSGRSGEIELFNAEQNFHLWTIQDAKDGDVLVVPPINGSEHSEQIFIFKEIKDRDHVKNAVEYYCRYMDNEFVLNEWGFMGQSDDYFIPATKEQRDLLFQKMYEAGYMWNSEKKELKKVHVIDEGKAEMDYCFTKMMNGEKVSSAWSEEDEKFFKTALWHISYSISNGKSTDIHCDTTEWLKSLKDRIGG